MAASLAATERIDPLARGKGSNARPEPKEVSTGTA